MKKMMRKEKNQVLKMKYGRLIVHLNSLMGFTKNEADCVELIKLVMQLSSLDQKYTN